MDLSNIKKINYLNETFDIPEGMTAEQVIAELSVSTDSVDMEVQGETLYIMAKTGTKGSLEHWGDEDDFEDEEMPEVEEEPTLRDKLVSKLGEPKTEKRVLMRLTADGKLVYVSPVLCDRDVDFLATLGIEVTPDTTTEEYLQYKEILLNEKHKQLATLLGVDVETAKAIVVELKKLV